MSIPATASFLLAEEDKAIGGGWSAYHAGVAAGVAGLRAEATEMFARVINGFAAPNSALPHQIRLWRTLRCAWLRWLMNGGVFEIRPFCSPQRTVRHYGCQFYRSLRFDVRNVGDTGMAAGGQKTQKADQSAPPAIAGRAGP